MAFSVSRLIIDAASLLIPYVDAAMDEEMSSIVRQHFVGRSLAFLSPLSRHLHKPNVESSNKHTQKTFNRQEFLNAVENDHTVLPFRTKRKRREFYEQWLNSPSFGLWIARQEEMMDMRA